MKRYKYPRTPHLPDSAGFTSDDIHVVDHRHFEGKDVVISEKLDGEAATYYSDGYFHARSIDSRHHPSRSFVINKLSYITLPKGVRLCGENLYAKHSIHYTNLKDYFLVYSVWEDDTCWDWASVEMLCEELGLETVPVIYKGKFDKKILTESIKSLDASKQEGIVIRNADSFNYNDFSTNVAKYVRPNHVQSEEHWMNQKMEKNILWEATH